MKWPLGYRLWMGTHEKKLLPIMKHNGLVVFVAPSTSDAAGHQCAPFLAYRLSRNRLERAMYTRCSEPLQRAFWGEIFDEYFDEVVFEAVDVSVGVTFWNLAYCKYDRWKGR
jgi:hypothetical protein